MTKQHAGKSLLLGLALGMYCIIGVPLVSATDTQQSTLRQDIKPPDCSRGNCSMQPPTIGSVDKNGGSPIISGTFDAGFTKQIQVTFGGKKYIQGIDSEIVIINGTWELDLSKLWPPLDVGSYEIIVEAIGYDGTTLETRRSVNFSASDITQHSGASSTSTMNRPRPSRSFGSIFFVLILLMLLILFTMLLFWRRRYQRVEENDVYYYMP